MKCEPWAFAPEMLAQVDMRPPEITAAEMTWLSSNPKLDMDKTELPPDRDFRVVPWWHGREKEASK